MSVKCFCNIVVSSLLLASPFTFAGEKLSHEQAVALFTNVTFDGHNEKKGKDFKVFSSASGDHELLKGNGKRKNASWRINDDGQHCVTFKRESCTDVISVGDGVYHKMKGDTHTHTLKNFTEGNNL